MKKAFLFTTSVMISSLVEAGTNEVSGTIAEVKTYEECSLIRLSDSNTAYLFPVDKTNGNAKLSIALSAFHAGSNVTLNYWTTTQCASVDSQLNQGEEAPSKYYVYSISTQKK